MEAGENSPPVPSGVDHLLYGVPDLEEGMDLVERTLGVRPVKGGRHPAYGTHNALLSLGPSTYLEVMAADPCLEKPPRGTLFGLDALKKPRLLTWVLRCEEIDDLAAAAGAGAGLGPLASGHRERPDGSRVEWRLSDPYALPLAGAVPFLISWGETRHPAADAPYAGALEGLRIAHPEPERVRRALALLGVEIEIETAEGFALAALIRTPSGRVALR